MKTIEELSLEVADLAMLCDSLGAANTPQEPEARRQALARYERMSIELAMAREELRHAIAVAHA